MLDRVVAACLEDVKEADEIALEVGARVLDGVANARLGGEVHHDVEAVLREQALDEGGVTQIAVHEGEAAVCVGLGQHAQARVLDAGVVIAVEVVEADDNVIGLLEQLLHQKRPNEAGSAGDKHFSHIYSSLPELNTTDLAIQFIKIGIEERCSLVIRGEKKGQAAFTIFLTVLLQEVAVSVFDAINKCQFTDPFAI